MIQLTLTLKMTTAQVVETSVTVNNNSPIQDYVHPDDQAQPFEMLIYGKKNEKNWSINLCYSMLYFLRASSEWHFFTPCLVHINAYLSAPFLVKQLTINKGQRIATRSWLFRFVFLMVTRGTWEYSFPCVLLSGFQDIIIKYICQMCKIRLMGFHGNELKTTVGNWKNISCKPAFFLSFFLNFLFQRCFKE